jgi:hypothetical protein
MMLSATATPPTIPPICRTFESGYNKVPPKVGPIGWVDLLWVVMAR